MHICTMICDDVEEDGGMTMMRELEMMNVYDKISIQWMFNHTGNVHPIHTYVTTSHKTLIHVKYSTRI